GVVINRKFINNMIRGRTESTMDAYKEIKERVENSGKSYEQMRTRTNDSDIDVDADYFTNKDLQKWMGLAGKTAAEYTRKLDKMELIYKDSSRRPHRHYLIDSEVSETAGITLRSLHNILASVIDREELGEWARKYYEIMDIQGDGGDILEKVAFGQEDLPITLDVGLERDDSLPTPLYQRFSRYKVEEATALKLENDGAVIMYGPDSVIASFSDKEPENGEDSEKEDETEESSEKVQEKKNLSSSVKQALIDAGATDSGEPVSFADLLEEVDMEEEELTARIDRLINDGEVQEPQPGDFKLLGEPAEVKAE
ncbi:MAG: hypothetical protein ABEK04_03230, partial [Candidatus Nanohalobium sp.]